MVACINAPIICMFMYFTVYVYVSVQCIQYIYIYIYVQVETFIYRSSLSVLSSNLTWISENQVKFELSTLRHDLYIYIYIYMCVCVCSLYSVYNYVCVPRICKFWQGWFKP